MRIPGYQLIEPVGQGGFAVVYRALHERVGRVVAVKVLSVTDLDERALRNFRRELEVTSRLSDHPNIVAALDTGTASGGRPYIVMDFYDGGSLHSRLRAAGALPVPETLRIGVKVAAALAAVHEAGVFHGDIKPQNILMSKYGEPALADFGVARMLDVGQLSSNTLTLTPHHAAPEVLNGSPQSVHSDVYALGSTLYQLLAGRPAFYEPADVGVAPLLLRVLRQPLPPLQRPDLPQALRALIERAMSKQPADRPAGAWAFARELQDIQRALGLPVTEPAAAHTPPTPAATPFPGNPPFSAAPTPSPAFGFPPAQPSTPGFPAPQPPAPSPPFGMGGVTEGGVTGPAFGGSAAAGLTGPGFGSGVTGPAFGGGGAGPTGGAPVAGDTAPREGAARRTSSRMMVAVAGVTVAVVAGVAVAVNLGKSPGGTAAADTGATSRPGVQASVRPVAPTATPLPTPSTSPARKAVLAKVTLAPDTTTPAAPGQTFRLKLAARLTDGRPANLTKATVVYHSADPRVATVSPDGVVTVLTEGEVRITAKVTLAGRSKVAALPLTVGGETTPTPSPSASADAGPKVLKVTASLTNMVRGGAYSGESYPACAECKVKTGKPAWYRETYFRFDLGSVKVRPARVRSVVMYVWMRVTDHGPEGVAAAHAMGNNWTSRVTFDTRPQVGNKLGDLTTAGYSWAWVKVDLTSYFRQRLGGQASVALAEQAGAGLAIGGLSSPHPPYLEITRR
ncbi:protein kinase [Nonomuraea sp. NPDC050310]|uniref:protein kinase domain-containing protein n=1 Tax=Nonomuraea sp. NPDC050310 TaxID=3154935 RepID=UPI0033EF10B9